MDLEGVESLFQPQRNDNFPFRLFWPIWTSYQGKGWIQHVPAPSHTPTVGADPVCAMGVRILYLIHDETENMQIFFKSGVKEKQIKEILRPVISLFCLCLGRPIWHINGLYPLILTRKNPASPLSSPSHYIEFILPYFLSVCHTRHGESLIFGSISIQSDTLTKKFFFIACDIPLLNIFWAFLVTWT